MALPAWRITFGRLLQNQVDALRARPYAATFAGILLIVSPVLLARLVGLTGELGSWSGRSRAMGFLFEYSHGRGPWRARCGSAQAAPGSDDRRRDRADWCHCAIAAIVVRKQLRDSQPHPVHGLPAVACSALLKKIDRHGRPEPHGDRNGVQSSRIDREELLSAGDADSATPRYPAPRCSEPFRRGTAASARSGFELPSGNTRSASPSRSRSCAISIARRAARGDVARIHDGLVARALRCSGAL